MEAEIEFNKINELQHEWIFSGKLTMEAGLSNSEYNLNRYRDIYPYDFNRVKLPNLYRNDYINASLVNNGNQTYIATQGPLENTVRDFWEMVSGIDSNEVVILMLTPLVEIKYNKTFAKCFKYWDYRELEFVDNKYFNIDGLEYTKFKFKDQIVHHLLYNNWPDHGSPNDIQSILRLNEITNELNQNRLDIPIIVHCSAGVGRTGTFISINKLVENPNENIYKLVLKLRAQRILSVQSLSQYRFLYLVKAFLNK